MRASIIIIASGLALGLLPVAGLAKAPRQAPAPATQPASPPTAQVPAQAQPVLPYPQALILIRSALSSLQDADDTGNYDVLYQLGAQGFQTANPPQKLAATFAGVRGYNLKSVLVLEPQFTQVPQLDANGMMSMSGFFISDSYRINFSLIYAPQDKQWRLFGLSAGVQPAAGN